MAVVSGGEGAVIPPPHAHSHHIHTQPPQCQLHEMGENSISEPID